MAILWNPKNKSTAADMRAAELGARSVGIQVRPIAAESPEGLAKALNDLANDRPEGLVVVTDGLTFARRQEIAEFAVQNRFASIFSLRAYTASGGLVSYGPDMRATAGRAATYPPSGGRLAHNRAGFGDCSDGTNVAFPVVTRNRATVLNATPRVHIPLERVALCLDCDACFDVEYHQCPACGSGTWSSVSRFIGQHDQAFAELLSGASSSVVATHGDRHVLA
jgi:hypothetical protein